jgi:hypothetical protein
LAVLAVRVFRLFSGITGKKRKGASAIPDAEIAHAIMAALVKPETPTQPARLD